MFADQWHSIAETFEEALTLDVDQREGFLQDRVADPALRAEIASLLEAHGTDVEWLERPLFGPSGTDEALEGGTVGPYRVLGVVGEGGMGIVYRAERADGSFDRIVPLKW